MKSVLQGRPAGRRFQPGPSVFDGEAFPDFIDPLVERLEQGVKHSVVQVKYVPAGQKAENPVMGFHVEEYLLNRMTDSNNNVPQDVHRTPHFTAKIITVAK